jgi:hypothetical protein
VTITFSAAISSQASTPYAIRNVVFIADGLGNVWQRQATAIVGGHGVFLPMIEKH